MRLAGRFQLDHNRHDVAMLYYPRAAEAMTPLGPSADLARALMLQGALESISHRAELAEPLLLAAIEIATQVGADDVRIWSLQYLATPLVDANQYEEAVELTEQSYREALAAGMVAIAESALNNLNSDYLWWPRPDHFQSAIDRLHALGTEVGATLALKWESIAAYYDGRLADSLAIATRMLEVATRLGNPREMEGAGRHIATVSSLLGRLDQARPYVVRPNPDEGIQAAVDRVGTWCRFHLANGDATLAAEGASVVVSDPGALVRALPWLDCVMEALLAAGELEDARSLARAAVVQPGYDGQPYLLVVAARLELAEGRTDAAVELARRAAELFGTVGDRVDGLSARIVLAQALTDAGRTDEATREVSRCLDDSRRIQARYFEEKASALARRIGFEMPESPTEAPVVEIGEKLVTVLFADIRGYTAMTTGLPPAELADRISAFQRWAQHEVNRHRGLIDKFAGDAVMATFNASGTSIDHSQHALEAAIALRDKAALLDLQIGVGIAVGPAIVGRLAMGANVSVLGETTNLASRLEGQASASEILLSAEGYRRVKDWLSAQGYQASRDTLELKGIARPAEAWRVGSRGLEAPTATSADDRFPLTKREREVAIMVADGLTNKQIATRLFRSERVIDNHVQHCFTKLGIHNRVELTRWVIDRGLVGADEADLSAPFKW